jgi:outer membrane protein OmpA-like peptidoglycan-associated protein
MRSRRVFLAAAVLGVASNAAAQQTDFKGSRDHSLIPRYAGSSIIAYGTRDYDELTLALGPSIEERKAPFAIKLSKSQRVEGKMTRLLYVAPEGRSSLEVFRNYETALKTAGFQPLFSCTAGECDASDSNPERFRHEIYGSARRIATGTSSSSMAFQGAKDMRYLAAKLSAPGKDIYASLLVAIEGFDLYKDTFNHPLTLLEIVETKAMEANMVTVDAGTMAKDIASTGRAVLYGIYFDTGKDAIKPESEPALAEIGKLLKQDRALKLYVVGHTDNVGGFDANMDLSSRRATSVVAYLKAQYGIEATRLRSVGVGLLAPVSSNESDDGRSKNRRVELVKQ